MRFVAPTLLMIAALPAAAAVPPDDRAAIAAAQPRQTIADKGLSPAALAALLKPVEAFYGFWNNGSQRLLDQAISPTFTDRALPPGRPQGPRGPMVAYEGFAAAVPDLRCVVEQRLIVGDRVVSHLRFTGHFTGSFLGHRGAGQRIDFIATDDLRVHGGRIADNWHLEDNLAFMKQIGAVK